MTPISGKAPHSEDYYSPWLMGGQDSRHQPRDRATRPGHETGPRGPYRRVGGVSGHLNPGGQQFRGDRGGADPRVTAALAAYQAGQGSEHAALDALAASRLLVPVIAVLGSEPSEQQEPVNAKQGDKDSEMVLPTLIGRDGRPAVLAFTGLDALARGRPAPRPAPCPPKRTGYGVPLLPTAARWSSMWPARCRWPSRVRGSPRWPPGSPGRRRPRGPLAPEKTQRR